MGDIIAIDKKMWELMGNTFYSVFFALLWSALLLWEKGIFSWDSNNYTIFIAIILIILFVYYIFDWLDANLATEVDPEIKKTDIFLWLLSTMWLATIIVMFIKKIDSNHFDFLCIPVFLSWVYSFLTTLFRDKLLAIKVRDKAWATSRNIYDKATRYNQYRQSLTTYNIVIFFLIILLIYIHNQGENHKPLDQLFQYCYENEIYALFIFMLLIFLPSLIMKILRSEYVLKPLSRLEQQNKS